MNKLPVILATVFAILSFSTKAQYITIPDAALRYYLVQTHPSCMNASQQLDTTCSSVLNATSFSTNYQISNWQGFQYFRNLQTVSIIDDVANYPVIPATVRALEMVGSNLTLSSFPALPPGLTHLTVGGTGLTTTLPLLPVSLTHLNCTSGLLTSLPTLPSGLKSLLIEANFLTSLPALPASLDTLNCGSNFIHGPLPALPAGLKYLDCSNNGYITSLSSSPLPSTLKYLDCSGNETLGSIPAFTSQVEFFHAGNCGLTSVPALPSTIKDLNLNVNQLSSLPVLPVALMIFACDYNQLTSMPALPPNLGQFSCAHNQLTGFTDPSFPTGLVSLACNDNLLTSLPAIPNNMMNIIDCQNNQLTSLPALPANLRWLFCQNNQLTSLPALPSLVEELYCNQNQLSSLPALPEPMVRLVCDHNNLTCLPFLPPNMYEVFMDNAIVCIPNITPDCFFINQGLPAQNMPVCNPINNINNCHVFPTMTGYVYYDNNNNLIKDIDEPYATEIKLQLSDGTIAFTNDNGFYSIGADALGTYTLSCASSAYHVPFIPQYTYNFSSYDTIVSNNFALQATAAFDSLDVVISNYDWIARPGFPFTYMIDYSNPGTTTVTPNVVFNYDNTRLIYDSSSNPSVINTGSSLQLAQPAMVPGGQNNFTAYFHVNAATPLDDTIFVNAHATANAFDGSHSIYNVVKGSYDPNDKSATPVLSPAQVSAGVFIDYSIRFQNTGTDTAFNIAISDTLDPQLEALSLQVTNSSHLTNIMLKDGIIYFEFDDIRLPDSNVNEIKSHGFVNFRIKPKSSVGLNDEIPNKAWIYFDFNTPIVTNTAITKILDPTGPVPLKLISFNVVRQSKNTANVYWSTTNEINVQKFFIETSFDGRNYSSIASQDAKDAAYNNYTKQVAITDNDIIYFRLKMVDVDGKFSYSSIVILKTDRTGNAFSFLNNPAKDILSISLNDEGLKNTVARIINAQGIVVKTVLLQNDRMDIDIKNFAAGTYVLQTVKGSRSFIIRN